MMVGCVTALPSAANAVYLVKIQQVGNTVVMTGSGSLNTASIGSSPIFGVGPGALVSFNNLNFGDEGLIDQYEIFERLNMSGVQFDRAESSTIKDIGIGANRLRVPYGYVSGSDLGMSKATYENTSLADLGFNIGDFFSVRLTNSERSDTFEISVVEGEDVPVVPEPDIWAMMLLGFGMIGMASRYRRRGAKVTFA